MATVPSSSLLLPTKLVLGFQRWTIRSEISAISISKMRRAKASPSYTHSHLLSSFRFENVKSCNRMKQRMPILFANPSEGDIVKGNAEGTETSGDPQGQGPPILTILAGFALFFFIAWIVGSIVMWLIVELNVGMEKEVLKAGNGPKPVRGQSVTVHCTGFGKNGDLSQKFWSTKDPGQTPFTFKIGLGSVIKGWDEGVMSMQVGEVARLRCSPDYAYGSSGFPAWGIQPNSVLVFEIEVLSVQGSNPILSLFSKLKS